MVVISSVFIAGCIHAKCCSSSASPVPRATQSTTSATEITAVGVVVDESGEPIELAEVTATGVPILPHEGGGDTTTDTTALPAASDGHLQMESGEGGIDDPATNRVTTPATPKTPPNSPTIVAGVVGASPYGYGSYYYIPPSSSPLFTVNTAMVMETFSVVIDNDAEEEEEECAETGENHLPDHHQVGGEDKEHHYNATPDITASSRNGEGHQSWSGQNPLAVDGGEYSTLHGIVTSSAN